MRMNQDGYGIINELTKCFNTMLALITSPYRRLHMTNRILTQAELKEQLHYNPETGIFTWIISKQGFNANKLAESKTSCGYIRICVNRTSYKAHRLAFLYMTGSMPINEIDHINRIRNDNRWCNLREATSSENSKNMKKYANNTTGFTGVYKHLRGKKVYQAYANDKGKRKSLGYFFTALEASESYQKYVKSIHGEFYRGVA